MRVRKVGGLVDERAGVWNQNEAGIYFSVPGLENERSVESVDLLQMGLSERNGVMNHGLCAEHASARRA